MAREQCAVARRKRESWLDLIASLPWPVGVVLGIGAFMAIRYGIPWYFEQSGSAFSKTFGKSLAEGPLAMFAWLALLLCWLGAGLSAFKRQQRASLFDSQANNLQLAALDWRQFERLVAEWFHRQGYQVTETGGGGPDGGIDLTLRKNGRTEIVQCKQWRRRQVPVATVREMWGLMQHHRADAVWIVCIGEFTPDAANFAAGKAIRLVTGKELGQLVQVVKEATGPAVVSAATSPPQFAAPTPSQDAGSPVCPKCSGKLVERRNRRTGEDFLGCESYPACRGTLATP
ncbi:MAG: restriction endonuclease [Arenimonas sp.]|nr:restriction endonuclease [Arenimonas sp.]